MLAIRKDCGVIMSIFELLPLLFLYDYDYGYIVVIFTETGVENGCGYS